jgi:hypothetical protein
MKTCKFFYNDTMQLLVEMLKLLQNGVQILFSTSSANSVTFNSRKSLFLNFCCVANSFVMVIYDNMISSVTKPIIFTLPFITYVSWVKSVFKWFLGIVRLGLLFAGNK